MKGTNIQGTIALLLASGSGRRIGGTIPKQFTTLEGKTIFEHAIDAFEKSRLIDHIIIVVNPQFRELAEGICQQAGFRKVRRVIDGGETRFQSSHRGLAEISDSNSYVLIHDVARPCVSQSVIQNCVEALAEYDAVTAAVPSSDTVFTASDNQVVTDIPPRSSLYLVQTPQGFKVNTIKRAHEYALQDDVEPTDDCSLVVKYRLAEVHLIPGDYNNIKVTHPVDLVLASAILRGEGAG